MMPGKIDPVYKTRAGTDGSRIGDKIILNNYLTHGDIECNCNLTRERKRTLQRTTRLRLVIL